MKNTNKIHIKMAVSEPHRKISLRDNYYPSEDMIVEDKKALELVEHEDAISHNSISEGGCSASGLLSSMLSRFLLSPSFYSSSFQSTKYHHPV